MPANFHSNIIRHESHLMFNIDFTFAVWWVSQMVFYLLTNKLNLSKLRLNGEQPTHHLSSYDLWHLEWCHTQQIHAVFVAVQSVGSVDKLIESVEQKPFNNFQKRF